MKSNESVADIEQVANNQNKDFFDKKKIFLFIGFFVATAVIIGLTLAFVLKIDFGKLISSLSDNLKHNSLGQFYIFLLCLFCLYRIVAMQLILFLLTRQDNIKISYWEWLGSSAAYTFISCIAPVGAFGNAYNLFWLKTKGYSTYKASAVSMAGSLIYFAGVSILALPCFISICINGQGLITDWIFWLATLGFLLNLGAVGFLSCFLFWKRISYWFSIAWNYLKKLIRLKYHTKEQSYEKYFVNQKLTLESYHYLFGNLWLSGLSMVVQISYFALMYLCMCAALTITLDHEQMIQLTNGRNYNWNVFSATALAVTASNFVPIPGGEGAIPSILHHALFHLYDLDTSDTNNGPLWNSVNNGIFVWRFLTYYLVAFVSVLGFVPMVIWHRRQFKNGLVNFVD